jgi:Protein of unknown function (DUF2934)
MQNLDQAIRERAYHLWIAAGCPEGNSDAHWLDAQRELLASSVAVSESAGAVKAKTKIASKTVTKTVTKTKPAKKSADKLKAPARSKRKAA